MAQTTLDGNAMANPAGGPIVFGAAPAAFVPPSSAETEIAQLMGAPSDGSGRGVTVALEGPSGSQTTIIRCTQCNDQIDVLSPGVRACSKVKQRFECARCASVDTRLRKLLGTWPIDEMRDAPEQDTFDFYRRAAASVGPHSLTVCVKHILAKLLTKRKTNRNRAEWLPMSVWEARGWTKDIIERHESKTDESKGVLWNINIEQEFDDTIDETVEQRIRDLRNNRRVKETPETLPGMPDRAAFNALFNINPDVDDAMSSSSSISSSSSGRKKNKSKKKTGKKRGKGSKSKKQEKKEKKEAAKQKELEKRRKRDLKKEKDQEREQRQQEHSKRKAEKEAAAKAAADEKKRKVAASNRVAKIKSDASKVLAKVTGPKLDIE